MQLLPLLFRFGEDNVGKNFVLGEIERFGNRHIFDDFIDAFLQQPFGRIFTACRQNQSVLRQPEHELIAGGPDLCKRENREVVADGFNHQLAIRLVLAGNARKNRLALARGKNEFIIAVESFADDKCAHVRVFVYAQN